MANILIVDDEETFARNAAKFLYGPRMKWLKSELQSQNPNFDVRHFETHTALADALKADLKPTDQILIKGSRGMKMETIWELLWKNP